MSGGEMIQSVELEKTSFNSLPWKFEAGTPAIVECVGSAPRSTTSRRSAWTRSPRTSARSRPTPTSASPPSRGSRSSAPRLPTAAASISFTFAPAHPHDVAQIVDRRGVCVRAGHHCTQPLMRRFGVPATTRASFYLYTVPEEIDRLCDGLEDVRELFA